jgi:hypothetical protein
MNKKGGAAWRIDAIDPRAGFTFASFRSEGVEAAEVNRPSAFVVGPDFRPTRLPDRIIGLAAARRSFQRGFFLGDREVDFATLEDIAEFTRRCYLRGGGGDGVDRGGGGPPPEPEGPPPDLPLAPEGHEGTAAHEHGAVSFVEEFGLDTKRFWELARNSSHGSGHLFRWSSNGEATKALSFEPSLQHDGAALLMRGAAILARELLRRLPVRRNVDHFVRWHLPAQRLGSAMARLGLWPELAAEGGMLYRLIAPLVNQLQSGVAKDVSEFVDGFPPPWRATMWAGFLFGVLDVTYLPRFHPYDFYRSNELSANNDPMDILESIPVPLHIVKAAHISAPHDPTKVTLQDVLSSVLGSPPLETERDVAELVMFAASCIVGGSEPPVLNSAPLRSRAIARVAGRAKEWLAAQLPRRAFGLAVEEAVRESTNLMGYREPPSELPSPTIT